MAVSVLFFPFVRQSDVTFMYHEIRTYPRKFIPLMGSVIYPRPEITHRKRVCFPATPDEAKHRYSSPGDKGAGQVLAAAHPLAIPGVTRLGGGGWRVEVVK